EYEAWAQAGGVLRSSYTQSGGTLAYNQAAAAHLAEKGVAVATEPTLRALRDAPAVIDFAPTSHDGTPRLDGAYGERLRWKLPHGRRGPRIELLSAVAEGNDAIVR